MVNFKRVLLLGQVCPLLVAADYLGAYGLAAASVALDLRAFLGQPMTAASAPVILFDPAARDFAVRSFDNPD